VWLAPADIRRTWGGEALFSLIITSFSMITIISLRKKLTDERASFYIIEQESEISTRQ